SERNSAWVRTCIWSRSFAARAGEAAAKRAAASQARFGFIEFLREAHKVAHGCPLVKSFAFPMLAPDLLAQSDPEVWEAIPLEQQAQEDHVELIASENYVSRQVLIAQGSPLTNKYAEGYPGKRYYGGCEYVDLAETLAIERAKRLFGAPWANVQPHS